MNDFDNIEMMHLLMQLATELDQNATNKFYKEGNRYVLRPHNFIAFTPLRTRNELIINLRGSPKEFQHFETVSIEPARGNSYSMVRMTSICQMHAVINYVERARVLAMRGPGRIKSSFELKEIPLFDMKGSSHA
jgi:hypothetical protein